MTLQPRVCPKLAQVGTNPLTSDHRPRDAEAPSSMTRLLRRSIRSLSVGLALGLVTTTAWAAPPAEGPIPPELPSPLEPTVVNGRRAPPAIGDKHSVQYSSLLAPRINPLGFEERLWIGYQYRLYDKD